MALVARTRLSTKGQMILPSSIRQARNWKPGTALTVEDTPDGVLVKAAEAPPRFPATRPEEVFGSLKHDGAPVSVDAMDLAISRELTSRRARDRY